MGWGKQNKAGSLKSNEKVVRYWGVTTNHYVGLSTNTDYGVFIRGKFYKVDVDDFNNDIPSFTKN